MASAHVDGKHTIIVGIPEKRPPGELVLARLDELGCDYRIRRGTYGDKVAGIENGEGGARWIWDSECPSCHRRTRPVEITITRTPRIGRKGKMAPNPHERLLIHSHSGCPHDDVMEALGLEDWQLTTKSRAHGRSDREDRQRIARLAETCALEMAADDEARASAARDLLSSEDAVLGLGIGIDRVDRRRVTIPERDEKGAIVGLVGYLPKPRRVPGDQRFDSEPGSHRSLTFRPERIASAGELWFSEGPSGAAALLAAGLEPVCWPSAYGWRDDWSKIVNPAQTVYVLADADDSGRQGARIVAESLAKRAASVVLVEIPERVVGEGGDAVDVLERNLGVGYLRLLARRGEHIKPAKRGRRPTQLDEARGLLVEVLGHGPAPSADVEELVMVKHGISRSTYERARKFQNVRSRKIGGTWVSYLPAPVLERDEKLGL